MKTEGKKEISFSALLPAVPAINPKDGNGNLLHEGDRVFGYDFKDGGGYKRVYGTLNISDEPKTNGHWCVDYDDGDSYIVLDFDSIFRADKA